jgi:hypothetical protein
MTAISVPRTVPEPISIPVRQVAPWAIFAGVMFLFLLYIVGCEQGATSLVGGHYIHEFVHDSRHLLGFPCH